MNANDGGEINPDTVLVLEQPDGRAAPSPAH